jgi:hypothetical protein
MRPVTHSNISREPKSHFVPLARSYWTF